MALASGELLMSRSRRGNCFNIVADVQIIAETGEIAESGAEGRIRVRSGGMAWPYEGGLTKAAIPRASSGFAQATLDASSGRTSGGLRPRG